MRRFVPFLFVILLLFGLSFLLPGYYGAAYPQPLGPELSPAARQSYRLAIEQQQAQVVLLGDSQLYLGVDETRLAEVLGQRVNKIAIPGSTSAAWYLITRHNIVQADPVPKTLVVFFRDSLLTAPAYRVSGRYYDNVVYENTAPDDSLFVQFSFIDQMNPAEKFFGQYLPLYALRETVRSAIDYRLSYLLPNLLLGCDTGCTNLAMQDVFGADNLREGTLSEAVAATEAYLYTTGNLDFTARVEHSYLPEMMRMTRESGIRLVLVRLKTLRYPDEHSEPAALRRYMADLRAYLDASDVRLLEYAHDERLHPDLFFDDYHMTEEGQAIFTDILAADLRALSAEQP